MTHTTPPRGGEGWVTEDTRGNIFPNYQMCSDALIPPKNKELYMAYPPSVEKALSYWQAADIPASYKKITPLYKFLWSKGIALPPVILADFKTNVMIFAILSCIFYPLAILLKPQKRPHTLTELLIHVIVLIVIIGGMAAYNCHQRRKFGLLTWQEIQNLPDSETDPK